MMAEREYEEQTDDRPLGYGPPPDPEAWRGLFRTLAFIFGGLALIVNAVWTVYRVMDLPTNAAGESNVVQQISVYSAGLFAAATIVGIAVVVYIGTRSDE